MHSSISILMAQINPKVGAIEANASKIVDLIISQQDKHDLIIFPELALTGYPPEDLLLCDVFYMHVEEALQEIQQVCTHTQVILGHPVKEKNHYYNAASVFAFGARTHLYYKQHLPNYGVFDEQRYFTPGPSKPCLLEIKGHVFGLCICEDIWHKGPVDALIKAQAKTIICINASPFDTEKYTQRLSLIQQYTKQGVAFIYTNLVGGQDELVFDGQSLALNQEGTICARSLAFKEHLNTICINGHKMQGEIFPLLSKEALMYQALQCGLHDYVRKNNVSGVVLGLSGGIDSALVLCLAADTLGPSQVHALLMPSRYTAEYSIEDAQTLAKALAVSTSVLSIEPTFNTLLSTLDPIFSGRPVDTTEENIQARIRGLLLMAYSNKTGKMLLNTSNKSEIAVGYSTLYGDMAGGFSPLKDVLKTEVYTLAHYRNQLSPVIPKRIITRAPSAELAPNQIDQDSLPDYAILDAILVAHMEQKSSMQELIAQGFPKDAVDKVLRLVHRNEYKRYQAPPGTKISLCAFGRDWRYPMSCDFLSIM